MLFVFTLQIFNVIPRAQNHVFGDVFLGFFVLFCFDPAYLLTIFFIWGLRGVKFPLWCAKWNLSIHVDIQLRLCMYISL